MLVECPAGDFLVCTRDEGRSSRATRANERAKREVALVAATRVLRHDPSARREARRLLRDDKLATRYTADSSDPRQLARRLETAIVSGGLVVLCVPRTRIYERMDVQERGEDLAASIRPPLEIYLISHDGYEIPEAAYEVVFDSGDRRLGSLDRRGRALLTNPPKGDMTVRYPDTLDVNAKAWAARMNDAVRGEPNWHLIFGLLVESSVLVERVIRVYPRYFQPLSGIGLEADLHQIAEGTEYQGPLDALLAHLEVESIVPSRALVPRPLGHRVWSLR